MVAPTDPPSLSLPGAAVSALAVGPDGEPVAAIRPDRAVLPASNAKLVTAALALDVLGPERRLRTTVFGAGQIHGRTLGGDLAVVGAGAPDLAVADLAALSATVGERVDRVAGDLVLDCTRFEDPGLAPGRTWTDARHAYGAPTSALAVGGNTATVSVRGDGSGDFDVSVSPATPAVETAVDVTADAGADEDEGVDVYADLDDGTIRVEGRAPPDASIEAAAPVDAPVRHFGHALRDALADAGVDVAGDLVVRDGDVAGDTSQRERTDLASVASAPVRDLVRSMNVSSDNAIADQLARVVAADATGAGSWAAWRDLVTDRFAALGVETVHVRDGSGLSRYDRIPSSGLVALLEWASEADWGATFFDSLPRPGEGTLSGRLDGVPVRAKTGTLTGARALSGRIERDDGDVLFSVLLSDLTVDAETARDRQDEWVRWLASR